MDETIGYPREQLVENNKGKLSYELLAPMDNLLKLMPSGTETASTPLPTPAKKQKLAVKPKLAVNLAGVLDEEDASDTGGEKDSLVAIKNHSGFTFEWRNVKAGKGKVTVIVTLPSGINPNDCTIKLLANNQNELCSNELSITYA